jgi:hypothetical protein
MVQEIQEQQKNIMDATWTTSPGSLNTARSYLAGAGIQTAALAFGGRTPSTAATEEYNGKVGHQVLASLNTARMVF